MIQKYFILLIPVFFLHKLPAFSQEFESRFKSLQEKKDTAGQRMLLAKWETANPKNPELFIDWFNYYVRKSATEVVALDGSKKTTEAFQVTDSGGKPVAFLGSSIHYNATILQKGFETIDKGIALYPARLDMRFGKIYMLGESQNYAAFAGEVTKAIDYGHKIKNKWLWKEGKPLEDAEKFFLGSMQDYVTTIYNTEEDSLLPYMRQIAESVLQYYPNHVESLANVALTYLVVQDYDKALGYLLKAEKAAPKDIIVLNNIAQAYIRKKDVANARIYLQKIIKTGNEQEVATAKEQLKQLGK